MYYHFAILLLFRPLIKLRIIGSSISPRDVCTQAADAIQGLLRSYSQLYTLRRTPSFVPYFVLTSAIMHLAVGATTSPSLPAQPGRPKEPGEAGQPTVASAKVEARVSEAIGRGIADLTEMAPCHHFAEQALNILRYLAKKWKIDVDLKEEAQEGTTDDGRGEIPGTRPVTSSLNFFAPNFSEQDFMCNWGGPAESPGRTDTRSAAREPFQQFRDQSENPLFWPFPMQGRPMIPSGPLLAEAGFELL